jgi:DNA-binding Lrp family transcriptional regulator
LSNHKKGSLRDKNLFRLLESQGALSTEQIQLLLFRDNVPHTARRRLKKLTDTGRIRRTRISIDEPYYYYADKKPGQFEHVLGVSWIYVWIMSTLTNMERLHCFDREVKDYKLVRPDAFAGVKNLWKDSISFFFIEMDIDESGNDFGIKVRRYNDLYISENYLNQWWVPLSKRFPPIIVATTAKIKKLQEKIQKENVHNLEFRLYSLDQIKEECLHGSSSSRRVRA